MGKIYRKYTRELLHNNLAHNLRFLCPNCHSQSPNFAGLSKGKLAGVRPLASGIAAGTPALD